MSTATPGLLDKALFRLFMREAVIVEVEKVCQDFCIVTFESASLRNYQWNPGEKLQIVLGSAFLTRTYTPYQMDTARGRLSVLAYLHGSAPGCDWINNAYAGKRVHIFGPRHSIDLSQKQGALCTFGDETSIGLSIALHRARNGSVPHFFEAGNPEAVREVLTRFSVAGEVVLRRPDESHLSELASRIRSASAGYVHFVLTGRAQGVQKVRRILAASGIANSRFSTKAYWAPGKSGMD